MSRYGLKYIYQRILHGCLFVVQQTILVKSFKFYFVHVTYESRFFPLLIVFIIHGLKVPFATFQLGIQIYLKNFLFRVQPSGRSKIRHQF